MLVFCVRAQRATPLRDETYEESSRRLRIFSVVLTFVAAAGALGRAFVVPFGPKQGYVPTLDFTTLAWVLLAIFAALLPIITEITIGSVSLRLRRQESVDIVSVVVPDLQKLMSDWCIASNRFTAAPRVPNEPWWETLERFALDRLREASMRYNATGVPKAATRLTVWLADPPLRELGFTWSNLNVSALAKKTFPYGVGIAGAAYLDQAIRNVVDPRSSPEFLEFEDIPYTFNSMLVVPMCFGKQKLGVICVDSMLAEPFDEGAIARTLALAAVLGAAIGVANAASGTADHA